MASDTEPDERQIAALSSISNEMVRIYKEHFGRGPTKARTHWAGEDVVVVTLEDTFTPAERSLQAMGEDTRMFFQYANVEDFCVPIERHTGRRVRGFVSGIDTREDIAVELFVLHPPGYDGPNRADRD
jgi:uncharacterized protein YbcI